MDMEEILREGKVKTVGYRAIVSAASGDSIRQTIDTMRAEHVGGAMVVDGDRLVGLFTERDLLKLMAAGEAQLDAPISSCMTRDPVCVTLDESIASAVRKMQEGGFRRLPVVDADRKPVGTLSAKRIVKFIADQFPEAVFNIPPRPDDFAAEREGA